MNFGRRCVRFPEGGEDRKKNPLQQAVTKNARRSVIEDLQRKTVGSDSIVSNLKVVGKKEFKLERG